MSGKTELQNKVRDLRTGLAKADWMRLDKALHADAIRDAIGADTYNDLVNIASRKTLTKQGESLAAFLASLSAVDLQVLDLPAELFQSICEMLNSTSDTNSVVDATTVTSDLHPPILAPINCATCGFNIAPNTHDSSLSVDEDSRHCGCSISTSESTEREPDKGGGSMSKSDYLCPKCILARDGILIGGDDTDEIDTSPDRVADSGHRVLETNLALCADDFRDFTPDEEKRIEQLNQSFKIAREARRRRDLVSEIPGVSLNLLQDLHDLLKQILDSFNVVSSGSGAVGYRDNCLQRGRVHHSSPSVDTHCSGCGVSSSCHEKQSTEGEPDKAVGA